MKKSLIFVMVLALAVIVAVPAFAFTIKGDKDTSFYFGALVYTDVGVWSRDADLFRTQLPGQSDRTEGILTVPRHSRVRGVIESGSVGAYWEIRLGANKQTSALGVASQQGGSGGAYIPEGAKLYGYYKFGNCTILAGKTDGHIFSVVAYQNLGFDNNNHIAGFGWGSIYDSRSAQIRWTQNFGKAWGYDISFVQSDYFNDNGTGIVPVTAAGARTSFQQWPMVAGKVRMNFGVVSLMPAAWVQYIKWNDLPGSADDNVTSYGGVLPVVVKVGAFTGTFQAAIGTNLATVLALESAYHRYYRDANGSVKNTTGYNGFADLAFTAGAVTPHFYIGYDRAENSDIWTVGDNYNDRVMYGVGVNWKLTNNFYIVPEFTYYDYGNRPGTTTNQNLGAEWLGGVQFQFVF